MGHPAGTVEGMLERFTKGFLFRKEDNKEIVRETRVSVEYRAYVEEQRKG